MKYADKFKVKRFKEALEGYDALKAKLDKELAAGRIDKDEWLRQLTVYATLNDL